MKYKQTANMFFDEEIKSLLLHIRHKVIELRSSLGWSQRTLARYAGITAPAINKIEKGHAIPSTEVLCRLAKVFKVGLGELVGLEGALRSDLWAFYIKFNALLSLDLSEQELIKSLAICLQQKK